MANFARLQVLNLLLSFLECQLARNMKRTAAGTRRLSFSLILEALDAFLLGTFTCEVGFLLCLDDVGRILHGFFFFHEYGRRVGGVPRSSLKGKETQQDDGE